MWATGTLWWERKLGPLCEGGQHTLECHVRRITANVLEVFTAGYIDDPPPG